MLFASWNLVDAVRKAGWPRQLLCIYRGTLSKSLTHNIALLCRMALWKELISNTVLRCIVVQREWYSINGMARTRARARARLTPRLYRPTIVILSQTTLRTLCIHPGRNEGRKSRSYAKLISQNVHKHSTQFRRTAINAKPPVVESHAHAHTHVHAPCRTHTTTHAHTQNNITRYLSPL